MSKFLCTHQRDGQSYATQIKSLFLEYGMEPKRFSTQADLQQSLGMVAAGEGIWYRA